jgi:hypothetical protein
LHSLATFNGMANALVIGSTVIQTDARITHQNFILSNMVYLLARMLPEPGASWPIQFYQKVERQNRLAGQTTHSEVSDQVLPQKSAPTQLSVRALSCCLNLGFCVERRGVGGWGRRSARPNGRDLVFRKIKSIPPTCALLSPPGLFERSQIIAAEGHDDVVFLSPGAFHRPPCCRSRVVSRRREFLTGIPMPSVLSAPFFATCTNFLMEAQPIRPLSRNSSQPKNAINAIVMPSTGKITAAEK